MTRMKENYEVRARQNLYKRIPVIIRLDGKAFHTYTKGLKKPFDECLIKDMQKTATWLCENIQGVSCAYTQSDEISLLLTDYSHFETEAWFDYEVQKVVSIAASIATARFNQLRADVDKLAYFDARVFNLPKEEVHNYFLARQLDAVKNSIAMLAQSLYSSKELHKKNGKEMQEMCFQKGYNWNDLPFEQKRGSLIVKSKFFNGVKVDSYTDTTFTLDDVIFEIEKRTVIRNKWTVIETPFLNRENLDKYVSW